MGRNWTATCARQHDPARRRIVRTMRNGKVYLQQKCADCEEIHEIDRHARLIIAGTSRSEIEKLRRIYG